MGDGSRHRCIVIASYYFEWSHIHKPNEKIVTGDKYAIHPQGSMTTYLAGLYRIEEERGLKYPVFTVLTRSPSKELMIIHDRMPVVLPGEAVNDWINPGANPDKYGFIRSGQDEMLLLREKATTATRPSDGCLVIKTI